MHIQQLSYAFLNPVGKLPYSNTRYIICKNSQHRETVAAETAPKKLDFPAYYSKYPIISRSYIKPNRVSEESQKTWYLTPWGLALISVNYIQLGFLFEKHPQLPMTSLVAHLKDSLSHTLSHFFPLAGRLETKTTNANPPSYSVSINCAGFPGVEFIHAVAKDVSSAQIVAPRVDVNNPSLSESLYAFKGFMVHDGKANIGVINHEGHTLPLLVVQMTELADAVFLSCSMNHMLADGTSFWHFFQSWAEISSKMMVETSSDDEYPISRPAIIKNWCANNHGPVVNLPSDFYDQIPRNAPPPPPPYWDRVFHFSAEAIALLKEQANAECSSDISSFQALNAFIWRCLTRVRQLRIDQETSCILAVSDRPKMRPRPSDDQLGCFVQVLSATTTAGELLANNLGWSAMALHRAVANHYSKKVRAFVDDFIVSPSCHEIFTENSMLVENSPRFKVYNDFGWGKPLAVRSGFGNKADGTMFVYPSRQGGGNIDIEMFLSPETMSALLSDAEFMGVASSPQAN